MPTSLRSCSSRRSRRGWHSSANTRKCPTGSTSPSNADIHPNDGTWRKEEPGVRPTLPWLSKRAFALSGAAVLSVSVLAACSSSASSSSSSSSSSASTSTSSSSSPSSSTPITIGASLSLTGDFSTDGQNFQKGYELWAADVNAHGGLLGHQVVLKILNDASSPTQ